ncbi:MAG: phosphomannomutase/phosphoglucomutase [Synergistota bacterium]|jgi:phosphomannomutase/phosphoglucomutase|nr:phosphomannomutase/phosphoglucomutase [Synergistota bacterium]OPZ40769.1 MAG: Phosphomannomutase/phosphoglucomutase [Synergistetes bacterium ADurb.BinA166]
MQISPTIFREYDIRGVADSDLTYDVVMSIGRAFGTWLLRRGVNKTAVGGDVRESTPRLSRTLIEGLLRAGLDVVDIGVVTTPVLYWSQYRLDAGGAVMITGSHNPKDMNGLKLAFNGATLYGDEIQEILRMILADDMADAKRPGELSSVDLKPDYIDMLLSKCALGPRRLKVVADSGNGTAGLMIREYLEALGCEVVSLFDEPDGSFPNHHPDPQQRKNLAALIEAVRREKADVGVAFDGDADRLGVVDERGEMIWGDILMALYWREILPKHPGADVIVEVKCSQSLVDDVKRHGGRPLFWKSGHSVIKAKMKEIKAVFAGELSGHFFFADEYYGFDDSFYAAARLLRILSFTDSTLSELLSDIPHYPSTAEVRIDCADERKFDVVTSLRDKALKDHEAITVDGVRILYPGGWGLIRASNTQPVIVTRCEGRTEADLERVSSDVRRRLLDEGLPAFEWTY